MRRRRDATARPAWRMSDLFTALGLAAAIPPAWLLPEWSWAPILRMAARVPLFTNQRAIRARARDIAAALDVPMPQARRIARALRAAIYEMSLQDLRGWRPGGWRPQITVEGRALLEASIGEGKGVLLWIAPFVFYSGAAKIGLDRLGYRTSHLSSPVHGFSETRFGVRFLNRIRCIPEDRHIEQRIVFDSAAPTTAMRRMVRALKAGGVVSIVAASTEGFDTVKAPLFGGSIKVATGAPRLAGLTGAPLLPLFVVREPGGRFRIAIEPPIALDAAQTTEERCLAACSALFRRAEPWIRDYPGQWRGWSKWRRKPETGR